MTVRLFLFGVTLMLAVLSLSGHAFAQDLPGLAGQWSITEIDDDDPSFSGTAQITYDAERDSVTAILITEDTCCNGKNYAKVKQKSVLSLYGTQVHVSSKIQEFLIREEELLGITYSADNFTLEWIDENTLIGFANGYTQVEWKRSVQNIS